MEAVCVGAPGTRLPMERAVHGERVPTRGARGPREGRSTPAEAWIWTSSTGCSHASWALSGGAPRRLIR
eukprot:10001143-Alexandrium_andersonii.AAC.1